MLLLDTVNDQQVSHAGLNTDELQSLPALGHSTACVAHDDDTGRTLWTTRHSLHGQLLTPLDCSHAVALSLDTLAVMHDRHCPVLLLLLLRLV